MSLDNLRCLELNVGTLSNGKAKLLLEWNEKREPRPYDVILCQETALAPHRDPVDWAAREEQLNGLKPLHNLWDPSLSPQKKGFGEGEFSNYKCYSSCREKFTNFTASGGAAIFVRHDERRELSSEPAISMGEVDLELYKNLAGIAWNGSGDYKNINDAGGNLLFRVPTKDPHQQKVRWGGSGLVASRVKLGSAVFLIVSVYRHTPKNSDTGTAKVRLETDDTCLLWAMIWVITSNKDAVQVIAGDFNFTKNPASDTPWTLLHPWTDLFEKFVVLNSGATNVDGATDSILDLVICLKEHQAKFREKGEGDAKCGPCETHAPSASGPKRAWSICTPRDAYQKVIFPKSHTNAVHFGLVLAPQKNSKSAKPASPPKADSDAAETAAKPPSHNDDAEVMGGDAAQAKGTDQEPVNRRLFSTDDGTQLPSTSSQTSSISASPLRATPGPEPSPLPEDQESHSRRPEEGDTAVEDLTEELERASLAPKKDL